MTKTVQLPQLIAAMSSIFVMPCSDGQADGKRQADPGRRIEGG